VANLTGLRKIARYVIGIFGTLEVRQMARHARGDRDVVIVVDVAAGTRRGRVEACQRKACGRVIKLGVSPEHGIVALFAGGGETNVIHRCRRAVEVLLVTRHAGCNRNVVVVVDMARGAGRRQVRSGQRKAGRGVIKLGVGPEHGIVALFARGRETGVGDRGGGAVKVLLVAGDTGDHRNVVVVVDVAGGAGRGDVRAGQRERRLGVIEDCRLPGGRVVANLTGLRKTQAHVIGILGAVEIRQVAGDATRNRNLVVVVDVAGGAGCRRVRARQRERSLGVVKRRRSPGIDGMAILAGLREACAHVVGILGILEKRQVAGDACRTGQIVVVVGVAIGAGPRRIRVASGQEEPCQRVIELRIEPIVRRVALFASSGKRGHARVFRIRCAIEILHMARQAVRGHGLELTVGRIFVAGIAIDGGMRAGQREAIVMRFDVFNSDVPAADRVALLAIRTELVLVDVGVTVGALLAHVRKHGLHVACRTSHAHVHAAQRVFGLVMVKFWNSANRLPALRGVAVCAGDVEIAVRALRSGDTRLLPAE